MSDDFLMTVFTAVLAFATVWLAIFTTMLWFEGFKTRKLHRDANVVVGLEVIDGLMLHIVVENLGAAVANNVAINMTSRDNVRDDNRRAWFEKERIFQFLKPEQRFAMSIGPYGNISNKHFSWDVTWKDGNGVKSKVYQSDAESYVGPSEANANWRSRALNSIERISRVLDSAISAGRVAVDVYNNTDRAEEAAAFEEQWKDFGKKDDEEA